MNMKKAKIQRCYLNKYRPLGIIMKGQVSKHQEKYRKGMKLILLVKRECKEAL